MKSYSRIILFISLFAVSLGTALAQEKSTGVKGKVRTSQNVALAEVEVTARKDGKDVKKATTDRNGAFELNGLEGGTYNLVFDRTGYNTGILYNVEIKKNKIRDLGNRAMVTDEGTLVIIRGIVFDQNGRSVRGANVEIERKQTDGSYRKVKTTTSSYGAEPLATGEFIVRFPETGQSEYRITATSKGVSASKELNAPHAAVYRLAITLNIEEKQEVN